MVGLTEWCPRYIIRYNLINMTYRFTTVITKEEALYVARALELGVVSQGATVEEAETNLKEAVELYLEGENAPFDKKSAHAPIVTSLEVEYA